MPLLEPALQWPRERLAPELKPLSVRKRAAEPQQPRLEGSVSQRLPEPVRALPPRPELVLAPILW